MDERAWFHRGGAHRPRAWAALREPGPADGTGAALARIAARRPPSDDVSVLVNRSGTLTLTARRWRSRLFLERRERLPDGATTALSMVFQRQQEFATWCSGEPVRFEEPLLLSQLRRFGDAAFSNDD